MKLAVFKTVDRNQMRLNYACTLGVSWCVRYELNLAHIYYSNLRVRSMLHAESHFIPIEGDFLPQILKIVILGNAILLTF